MKEESTFSPQILDLLAPGEQPLYRFFVCSVPMKNRKRLPPDVIDTFVALSGLVHEVTHPDVTVMADWALKQFRFPFMTSSIKTHPPLFSRRRFLRKMTKHGVFLLVVVFLSFSFSVDSLLYLLKLFSSPLLKKTKTKTTKNQVHSDCTPTMRC